MCDGLPPLCLCLTALCSPKACLQAGLHDDQLQMCVTPILVCPVTSKLPGRPSSISRDQLLSARPQLHYNC